MSIIIGNNHKNKNNNNTKYNSNNKVIQRKLKIIRQESCGIIVDIYRRCIGSFFFLCNYFYIGKNEKSCVLGIVLYTRRGGGLGCSSTSWYFFTICINIT